MRGAAHTLGLGFVILVVILAAACSPERTMLVVRVDSNITVPDALDSVRVVVTHAGKALPSLLLALGSGAGKHTLPLQVGLLSPSGGGADVTITVSGQRGSTFVVAQDAVTSFIEGKSLVLDMYLAAECVNFDCQDRGKTCTRGQACIDVAHQASTLPVFDPHAGEMPRDAAADGPIEHASTEAGDVSPSPDGTGGVGGAGGTSNGDAAADVDANDAASESAAAEVAPEAPSCVPKTEDCFNGLDDDCDGLPDCADPDCAPSAVCVPRPSGDVGTSVAGAAGACPAGFAMPAGFGSNPQPGGSACTGCTCAGGAVTSCTSNLTTYTSAADCQAGTNGRAAATVSTTDPTCPVPDTNTPYVFGAELSPWHVSTTACVAGGAPVKPTGSFATPMTFCKAARVSDVGKTGCAAGFVCMPKPAAAGGSCVLLTDAGACPTGTKQSQILYAGLTDTRTCGACSCALQGASCDNLVLQMGSDYSCGVDMADIKAGARNCTTQQPLTGVYTPGYHLMGTPTNGTCAPSSALAGTLTPTGGRALCCLP